MMSRKNEKKLETIFLMNEKRNEYDEMRVALASIADEIERYKVSSKLSVVVTSTALNANKTKINDISYKYKSKHKSKRQLIAKLRKDLKAACLAAKTLESLKKKEINALTTDLVFARGECVDLLKKYNNNRLGQLKKLIESCGQYYADYCNKTKINMQIKQRNRFLKNKINILENNIEAIKEQLKALEYRYLRLQTENNQIKDKYVKPKCLNYKIAYSAVEIKQSIEEHENSTDENRFQDSGDSFHEKAKGFNLSTHLNIVKRLLSDQDALLKDLTFISKEMSIN